ncbi:isoprenylcysteine carboxylmethyltransferase family protein [Micromonospora sp. 4G57]|uniref:Isoprenylcysteine carboxylmethyltransferase family protein n=1 Tax=Micromonospora sicca TaxID=2202420 RepID=A0ABU5JE50_9ACTN|nr:MULTISPECIES: isoprenylcysteine carboxylmethyltransferase family protein [unclassified Micromonospora]MDZ5445011.1 isoprenylcysteine carboxylmethyltransferase family protein [Micromonospora sp. 4G57]MDZ5490869.1 isoprenylcysteine carboxylmethyltransferase family protein [Micromonospora sp. 4G53]
MRMSLSSTSTRTFLIWPLMVGVEQALSRRRVRGTGLPLMAAGYAAYRLAGAYRLSRAGGPPGMSQGMPERLVEEGPYRWTRNPMYGGHLLFLTGLALSSRSPLAAGLVGWHLRWFADRVRRDEQRLRERFGGAYEDYCARTPRWIARRPAAVRPLPGGPRPGWRDGEER